MMMTSEYYLVKMHQNRFSSAAPARASLSELKLLRCFSRPGGDTSFPIPLDAFGVSNSAPTSLLFSGPLHKFLAAPV